MKHSKEFERARGELQKRESSLREEIELDTTRYAKSGKRIILFATGTFLVLLFGGFFSRGGSKKAGGRKRGSYRWVGRMLEFLIPFMFTSLLEYRKKQQLKEINNS